MLWRTFDRGSWVAPQLSVALSWADPGFIMEARRRITSRCPVDDDDGFFGGDTRHVSARNLASLLRAAACVSSDTSWVAAEHRAHDVQELLNADRDAAGAIVEFWYIAARARFTECEPLE
jgi:hypothetical protein